MAQKPRQLVKIKPTKYEGMQLLKENKKYWKSVFNELDKKKEKNAKDMIHGALPVGLGDAVCSILGLEIPQQAPPQAEETPVQQQRIVLKEPYLSYRHQLHIERELNSDTDVEYSDDEEEVKQDVHREFLKKPIRENIQWATRYLEPEKDHEKNLIRRADDITDRIAQEFSDYIKQLGGDQQSHLFDPKTIKELFQIQFDTHVSRSLRVVPKELPAVKEGIATAANSPESSYNAALEREISKDIEAENIPDRLLAFRRSLPRRDQWRNPNNNTKASWLSTRNVPQDLVTLKTVWEGITNLRSVKEYCRWMIDHPELKRPPYLNSMGMFDRVVLDSRPTLETQQGIPESTIHPELPASLSNIRRRLSSLY